jgi:hypothetical protein
MCGMTNSVKEMATFIDEDYINGNPVTFMEILHPKKVFVAVLAARRPVTVLFISEDLRQIWPKDLDGQAMGSVHLGADGVAGLGCSELWFGIEVRVARWEES